MLGGSIQLICAGVGALYLGWKTFGLLRFLLDIFVVSGTNLSKYGSKGSWAVVTGASDGLGKEFAAQLAAKGFNIVLVSRTLAKLEAFAAELERTNPGLQTRVLAMDFAADNSQDYERLRATVAGLDVAILINNVGQSHSIPVPFLQTEEQELQSIVNINCLGTLKTTAVVAPLLKKRKKGLILTMGSLGGWTPTPYLATYSGSKAFLQHWSSALAQELRDDGVDVQLILSYLITTAMSKIRRSSAMVPTPRDFVRAALSKVGTGGWMDVAFTYTPWWTHAILTWTVENTVGAGNPLTIWYNMKAHVDIRNRALRKASRETKQQ